MKEYNNSQDEHIHIKNKIINMYEHILEKFCTGLLKFESRIKAMKRGIILPDGEEHYEDYFTSTHTELKEKIRREKEYVPSPVLMVIKIFTHKKEEIIFSTDIKSDIHNKKIIYLDDALENTPKLMKHLFYNKISELKAEEKIFRDRKKLEKIQIHTNNKLKNELIQ